MAFADEQKGVVMKYIERIAKKNQLERKQAIIDVLNEMGVRYVLQNARVGEHCVENIVFPIIHQIRGLL